MEALLSDFSSSHSEHLTKPGNHSTYATVQTDIQTLNSLCDFPVAGNFVLALAGLPRWIYIWVRVILNFDYLFAFLLYSGYIFKRNIESAREKSGEMRGLFVYSNESDKN
ncbi:hypothetical protein GQX74_007398 [Glossina fuscipes]|nr:hypothetical protein GQX74_007398 [Glossina fuscipes]